jgi:Tfp pilus assembly protein PilN
MLSLFSLVGFVVVVAGGLYYWKHKAAAKAEAQALLAKAKADISKKL